ncbi:hypothetical protein, partial [Prescottella equi]|uniref:hypothetical protein n=1 Tax=Rhodococcus hoagii TaxID=43767 RepID=UPI001F2BD070
MTEGARDRRGGAHHGGGSEHPEGSGRERRVPRRGLVGACRPRCVADGGRDMDPHPHGHRRGDGYGACAEARRARRRVPRSSSFPGPSTRTSRWPC